MARGPGIGRQKSQPAASGERAPDAGQVIRDAAERLLRYTSELAPGLAPQEISDELRQLCDQLERETPLPQHHVPDPAARLQLRSRLLDLLRAETVQLWTEAPPRAPIEMLCLLQRFERLKVEVESSIQDDALPSLNDSRGLE